MGDKLLCPNIVTMLTKTIRALCEVNVIYDHKLEINGCLFVRSDGEKVLTCLIDEEFSKGQTLAAGNNTADVHVNNAGQNNNGDYSCDHHEMAAQSPDGRYEKLRSPHRADALGESADIHISKEAPSLSGGVNTKRETVDRVPLSTSDFGQFAAAPDIGAVENGSDSCLSDESVNEQNASGTELFGGSSLASQNLLNPLASYTPKRGMTLADFSTFMHLGRGRLGMPENSSFDVKKEPDHIMTTPNVNEAESRSYPNVRLPTSVSSSSQIPYPLKYMYGGGQQVASQAVSNIDSKLSDVNASYLDGGHKKKFQCLLCGIFLSAKCYLKSHINAVHTKARMYPCEACKKVYYSPGAVRIHKLRNHWHGAKKHKCQFCGELFLLPVELRKHLLKMHRGDADVDGALYDNAPHTWAPHESAPVPLADNRSIQQAVFPGSIASE